MRRAVQAGRARGILVQIAVTVALLPWLVQPGVVQPDTKIDLVVSPGRYLMRALHAWSGHSGFGELQNQAYGYLFPMGPVFWVGHEVGLPGWAVQRVWWSLLLFVACTGAMAVGRRVLGLSVPAAAAAGALFALSPRVLTLLSELSVEAWPGAIFPWLVLVVHRRERGDAGGWRFAARVGALACLLGGVNATASLVPLVGAWLVLLWCGGRWRASLWFWAGALAGVAWWLGPLVVLGGYAYPFMDYIETSRITTAVTSVPGVLRGASDWVAYIIDVDGHPVWQSGWVVAQATSSIVLGLALVGVGLYGLAAPGTTGARFRERRLLAGLLTVGVVVMGAAYVGGVSGPFAPALRGLLDGPLAAARNVHKADPLVRLPLVLGVGLALDRWGRRRFVAGCGVLALAAASVVPFWQGRLGDAHGVTAYPASVARTARALDADAEVKGGSTLVLPSARTASFTWGTSTDEPLTAFAASPIAWRASAPLVHPGAQRLMDAVDAAVAQRRDLPAVGAALRRAGVQRIVVRSGLTSAEQATPSPQVVSALLGAPRTFTRHRTFGHGQARYDVFEVAGSSAPRQQRALGVLGGPESTTSLAAAGVRPERALVLGQGSGWLTDDVRKRVDNNGRSVSVAFGPTLTAQDRSDTRLGARDLVYPGRSASLTTLGLWGLDTLSATASAADPFADTYLGPGAGPGAALDDDSSTAWLAPLGTGGSLVLGWHRGTPQARRLTVTPAAAGGARVTGWSATADGEPLAVTSGQQPRVTVPAGTRRFVLTPHGTGGSDAAAVGVATLTGADGPMMAVPHLPGRLDTDRSGVVLSREHAVSAGIVLRAEDGSSWSRAVDVSRAGTMEVRLTPTSGASCRGARLTVGWPGRRGAERAVDGTGCTRRVHLDAGTQVLRMSGSGIDRVVLVPQSPRARAALGLAPSTSGTVVTGTESGANAGWVTARHGARPVVLDGWRQAFVGDVPPGTIHFGPQRFHALALGIGGVLGVATLLMGLVSLRRRPVAERRPTADDSAPPRVSGATTVGSPTVRAVLAAALTGLVGVVLAGWWGVAVVVMGAFTPPRHRARAAAALAVVAGPIMAAFGVVAHASLGAFAGQLLGVAALVEFMLAFVDEPWRWRGARPRSTKPTPARD